MISDDRSIVIGTMNFGRMTTTDESVAILHKAYDSGIGAINTADTDYSGTSETIVGAFLKQIGRGEKPFLMVELSGRDMGVPNNPNLTPDYLQAACERSLKRLGVSHVDRVVLPRPSFTIPIEETLDGAFDRIVSRGLADSIGVSTFPAWLTCHAQHVALDHGLPPLASELAPFNVLDRRAENELLPNTRYWAMEFFAWGSLAQGLLAGRYSKGTSGQDQTRASLLGGIYAERTVPKAQAAAERFVELATRFGLDPAAAAVSWCSSHSGVTGAVVGPRHRSQVAPLAAARELRLSREFLDTVDAEVVPPGSAAADFFNSAPWMMQQIDLTEQENSQCMDQ